MSKLLAPGLNHKSVSREIRMVRITCRWLVLTNTSDQILVKCYYLRRHVEVKMLPQRASEASSGRTGFETIEPTYSGVDKQGAMAMLKGAADGRVAEQSYAYFKAYDRVAFVGVRAPKVREIEKQIFQTVRRSWSLSDSLLFSDSMIRSRYLEASSRDSPLVALREKLRRESFGNHPRMARGGHCSNWARRTRFRHSS